MHVASLAADKGLIHLDIAVELLEATRLHGESDAMQHEPRGLLRDPECPRQLMRADPVLGVGGQPDGGEPLV